MAIDVVSPLGATALLSVDLVGAIWASDLLGLLCLALLLLISIGAWGLIVAKWRALNRASLHNRAFRRACERDGQLDAAYLAADQYPHSPLARVFHEAYFEAFDQNWYRDFPSLALDQRLNIARQSVERSIDRAITDELARLDAFMIPLGTVSTICPFIGLFGTVWGVLAAFQSLAAGGAADITTLAPGISTALTTTIFGLFPAICAVVAYNYFSNRIQSISSELDAYSMDLQAVFQREVIRRNDMRVAA